MARYVDDKFDLLTRQVVENVGFLTLPNLVKCGRLYSFASQLLGCMPSRVDSIPVLR